MDEVLDALSDLRADSERVVACNGYIYVAIDLPVEAEEHAVVDAVVAQLFTIGERLRVCPDLRESTEQP